MLVSCSLLLFDWLSRGAAVELTYGDSCWKICGSRCSQSEWCVCVCVCLPVGFHTQEHNIFMSAPSLGVV